MAAVKTAAAGARLPLKSGPGDIDRVAAALKHDAGRPEAIARLAELLQKAALVPPGRLVEALRAVVDEMPRKAVHPLVFAQAAYRLSLLEEQMGENQQASAHRQDLGLLGEAWVLGPFDAQGRSALDRRFAPEADLAGLKPSETTSFVGKDRNVSWRRAPAEVFVQGTLFLDGMLRPDSDSVAYVLAYVRSDRDRQVALRVGSPGPTKAWLGEREVLSKDVVRPADFDQDAAAMYLRRGDNRLLIKTVITRGAWRLTVRLTDPDGQPLSGVSTSVEVPAQLAAAGTPPAAKPTRELDELLRQRTQARAKGEVAASAWLDYARFLSLVSPADLELRAAEEAAKRATAVPGAKSAALEALLFLGDVAREDDERRAALDRALPDISEPAEKALALASVAQLWHRQRRDQLAVGQWRAAIAEDASCVPAQLALAREEQRSSMLAAAKARLDSLPQGVRELPVVQSAMADVLQSLGRRSDAEALFRSVYDAQRTATSAARDLASSVRARGDLGAAAKLYAEAARWRPDLVSLVFDQAAMLAGQGLYAEAVTVYRNAMERLPDDASLPEELGRLEARTGHVQEAVASMRRSLDLRPQNPGLRRYLDALVAQAKKQKESRSIDELVAANAENAEKLAREVLFAADNRDVSSAEVILDRTVVRVHGNGLSERFVQRLVHLRTERAANDSQETWIRYEPGRQEVEVRKARVFRRGSDGAVEISEATARDERDLSEPWYGLYYDSRAEVVVFENLRAGDLVEIQYSLADVAYSNELSDYFGDFELIADNFPTRRWDYTLIAPKGRTIYFNSPLAAGVSSATETRGDETVYKFSAEHVARVESEPAMPGIAEIAPYLHVSTYKSWQDVGHWYWNLVVDQMQDDGTLKKAAVAATAGLTSTADKVKAIHRLVVESTRYVGLEFGIHGYKPYKATQVLERRFGDCKDKASLLVTLLRAVGVDAEMVLLRTRHGGRIADAPASLAVFDHAIAYVPALDQYLDGTAEFSGLDELPSEDQNVMALRVTAKGATLVQTPELPAASNRAQRRWTVDLQNDGSARIAEDLTVTGQAAHEWREHYQTEGERRERYAKVWNGRYAGSVLNQVEMKVNDRNQPVAVHAVVHVPRMGERRMSPEARSPRPEDARSYEIALPLSSREADFTSTYARLGKRQWPLVLGYPWHHEEAVTYHLPDGALIVRAPAPRTISSRFGEFTLGLDERTSGVEIKTALVVNKSRIEPSEYAAFRAFLRDTDALLSERLVVDVKGAP
jgi:transglutaminase-like putative cysteine protease/tetratricopeptide (TPR) repeat protein